MVLSPAVEIFVALGIGALVGIERERSEPDTFAGSRTLPLVALFGALVQAFFPDVLPFAFALLVVLVTVAYAGKAFIHGDIGLTTGVATVLTFLYGAMATHSETGLTLAVVFGTLTTAILASKKPIHSFASRIGRREMRGTLKFLIVALVVLPLLPDRSLDVLLGLNPRFVWMMVVFVSGISYSAYLLTRLLGPERGIGLTGVLGGLVSSTATSMSMAEKAREEPLLTKIYGVSIVIASLAMLPRILIEVLVVNRGLLLYVGPPVTAMAAVGLSAALLLFKRYRSADAVDVELKNPFRLRSALLFGAFFALILLVSREGNTMFGDAGIYATALLSGLADVDAITLSLSSLALDGQVSAQAASTGIVLAAVTNTLVKLGIAWFLGTSRLGRAVAPAMLLVVAAGIGTVLLL